MSASEEVKFRMKVLINKQKNKVLFAEVDSDLADILVSFLTLPLGTMVRLLSEHYGDEAPVIGSLNALYKGLVDLDGSSFDTKLGKQMLIKPKNPFEDDLVKLKVNIDDTEPTKYFTCEEVCSWNKNPVIYSMYDGTTKCACGKLRSRGFSNFMLHGYKSVGAAGGFTKKTASFIISDDLQMLPDMIGSSLQILNNLDIKGANKVKEKTLIVGFEEIMDLLKGSLVSRTPLTDLVFNITRHRVPDTEYFELGTVKGKSAVAAATTTTTSKKMTVKAIVQKSTGKILVAQAMEDFVDFVFSLLTIPLGGALSLLGGDFSVGSIHNLHRSLSNLDGDRYLNTKNPFKTPQLSTKYLSKYQIFPLTEKTPSFLKYESAYLLDPKGWGSYVKGPATFMVTDDLVVTKSSAISGLYILNSLDIPTSDTEEYVIDIGMEEGLGILRASLSTSSALSNGLEPFLKKRFTKPKLEK